MRVLLTENIVSLRLACNDEISGMIYVIQSHLHPQSLSTANELMQMHFLNGDPVQEEEHPGLEYIDWTWACEVEAIDPATISLK